MGKKEKRGKRGTDGKKQPPPHAHQSERGRLPSSAAPHPATPKCISLRESAAHLLLLVEGKGVSATSAGVAIVVDGHEGGRTARRAGALTTETGDLVVLVNLAFAQNLRGEKRK